MVLRIKFIDRYPNRWFDIQPGFVLNENYNETLDSATILINQLSEKIKIIPYDRAVLEIGQTQYFMCVDTYFCSQVSFSEPYYYMYQITLFSETKLLEGVILPSLKITQLKNGNYKRKIYTDNTSDKQKFGYLDEYLKEYGPRIRIKDDTKEHGFRYEVKWSFSDRVKERFSKIQCPEMQWNQPTLREVLNDLMMIDDCIVVMRNGVIDYIDISETKNNVSLDGISQIQESMSAEDYVSDLRVELKNVMQSKIAGVNDVITAVDKIGFRVGDNYVINQDNFRLETLNPILEIEQVLCSFIKYNPYASEGGATHVYCRVDLTPYIKEYDEFRTLPIYYNGSRDYVPEYESEATCTANCMFFRRGGTTIENLSKVSQGNFFPDSNVNSFQIILGSALYSQISNIRNKPEMYDMAEQSVKVADLPSYEFIVKYKTLSSSLLEVGRNEVLGNKKVTVDNQTNSYVDAYAQGILEYLKVNRLGNEMIVLDGRYSYSDNIPQLGDVFMNEYIIFRRNISYADNCINVNFYATKNYVLRDYFTGVQSKIRSWKIVDGNEALERHDLIKYYLEFSYNPVEDITFDNNVSYYMCGAFYDYKVRLLDKTMIKLYDHNDNEISQPINYSLITNNDFYIGSAMIYWNYDMPTYIMVDAVTRVVGDSIIFTFGFSDNFDAGKKLLLNEDISDLGGVAEEPTRYVDENGENIGGYMILSNYIYDAIPKTIYNKFLTYEQIVEQYEIDHTAMQYNALQQKCINSVKPIIGEYFINPNHPGETEQSVGKAEFENREGAFQFKVPFTFHKDNSEVTRITTQFEFCSDTDEICFGSEFLKDLPAIRTHTIGDSYYRCYHSNIKPNLRNRDRLPSDVSLNLYHGITITAEKFSNTAKIILTYSDTSDVNDKEYIYLHNNKKIILAFKKQTPTRTEIYLNCLKERNKDIYDENGEIIGSIYQESKIDSFNYFNTIGLLGSSSRIITYIDSNAIGKNYYDFLVFTRVFGVDGSITNFDSETGTFTIKLVNNNTTNVSVSQVAISAYYTTNTYY